MLLQCRELVPDRPRTSMATFAIPLLILLPLYMAVAITE